MALNNVGGQVPFSNTFQTTRDSNQARVQDEARNQAKKIDPRDETQSTRSAAASEFQESEESNRENILQELLAAALSGEKDEVRRGSVLDIQV